MLKEIECEVGLIKDGTSYIGYNGRYFKISRNAYDMILMLKEGKGTNEIAQIMGTSTCEIENAISKIENVIVNSKSGLKIKALFKCLGSGACDHIGKNLVFLFGDKVMVFFALISAIALAISYMFFADFSFISLDVGFPGYLAAFVLIMIVHETGHICAAYRFGISGLKIEAGVFYIWPVFFVQLNKQALLPKKERMVVSAGGLYFQLLLSFLCVVSKLFTDSDLISLINNLNLSILLFNSFPALILDGYWLYSDWAEIENLNAKALRLIKGSLRDYRKLRLAPFKLVLYSSILSLTISVLAFWIIYLLVSGLKYFPDIYYQFNEGININLIFRSLLLLMPYFLLSIYLIKKAYDRFK